MSKIGRQCMVGNHMHLHSPVYYVNTHMHSHTCKISRLMTKRAYLQHSWHLRALARLVWIQWHVNLTNRGQEPGQSLDQ